MIVEERIYTLHPGQAGAYLKAYESEGMAIQKPILGRMVGYYQTEFGTLNQVIHMWAYEDLAERTEKRARLQADARWQAYVAKVRPLILKQENWRRRPFGRSARCAGGRPAGRPGGMARPADGPRSGVTTGRAAV